MEIDRVLEEYRTGDADKRMSLYLYHRGLRDAFDTIEQEDPLDPFAVRSIAVHDAQRPIHAFIAILRGYVSRFGPQASIERTKR